jgi:uncharacterized alpha-E superfamily protein
LPIVQASGDDAAFFKLHATATGPAVTEFLVFQPENPNSIVQCISQARENARMVRDQITVDLWEELNTLYLFARSPEARDIWRRSPSDFFARIKASSLLIIGISNSTLTRNEGWWFIQVGKFIERADKTSRILDVRFQSLPERGAPGTISQAEAVEWSAILHSCSAWDAYKAAYGADVHPRHVAELLVLNEDFPRSVRFCAEELSTALRRLSGATEGRFANDVERHSGRLLAELRFSTGDELFERGLHRYLDELQGKLNQIGDALFNAYFFLSFAAVDEVRFVQQEEQQQQSSIPAGRTRADA